MDLKITPGHWDYEIDDGSALIYVHADEGDNIHIGTVDSCEADARAIAALPDLLTAIVEYRLAGIAVTTDASHAAGLRFYAAEKAVDEALRQAGVSL